MKPLRSVFDIDDTSALMIGETFYRNLKVVSVYNNSITLEKIKKHEESHLILTNDHKTNPFIFNHIYVDFDVHVTCWRMGPRKIIGKNIDFGGCTIHSTDTVYIQNMQDSTVYNLNIDSKRVISQCTNFVNCNFDIKEDLTLMNLRGTKFKNCNIQCNLVNSLYTYNIKSFLQSPSKYACKDLGIGYDIDTPNISLGRAYHQYVLSKNQKVYDFQDKPHNLVPLGNTGWYYGEDFTSF